LRDLTAARWALCVGMLSACASSGARLDSADSSHALTPGAQCLEDARAERAPTADAPRRIRVAHLLVRHAQLKDPLGATRTPEQACLRALDALNRLKGGGEWDAVVAEFSDSKTSDLGQISKDEVTPGFAAAAFELEANQLSYVVETDRGFHVIVRLE
jgi:peptidyl-prolyl cis-trans isomerase NIMA-interacting 1